MFASTLIPIVMCVNAASASWSGIAVVGQDGNDGQIYIPDVGAIKKIDNFGAQKTISNIAGTACHCRFYTSGGQVGNQYSNAVMETDPRTDTSRILTHMTTGRRAHSMTCSGEDTMIMCGGFVNDNTIVNSCDICHITNPICVALFPMPKALYLHASVVSEGHLYIIGGIDGQSRTSNVFDFSLLEETWTQRASMNSVRGNLPGAIALSNGHILVCGGISNTTMLNTCESYDPTSDRWTMKASMNKARRRFKLVRYEGRVMAIGSWSGDSGFDTVESYDEFYDTWTMEALKLVHATVYSAAGGIDHSCVF